MRKLIWKALLDADMNVRYWKYMAQRLVKRDCNTKIFLAVMSSSTVGSWWIWEDIPYYAY